jgi:two-component system phosphate regulon response regulator OmpR
MTECSHVLVVDDDTVLRDLVMRYLGQNGFEVIGASDGLEMRQHLSTHPVDLVLLDIMLPGEDGLSLARGLREHGGPPVIMLSARGEAVDRIVGLEVGADDYLAKPFDHRELLARVRAVLRRAQTQPKKGRMFRFGPYVLDREARRLNRNGETVPLSGAEFTLLTAFVDHTEQVLSRDRLVDLLRGYDRSPFDRMVDVRVTRLRRRIENDPAHPVYIRTVRGEGYLFTPGGQEL